MASKIIVDQLEKTGGALTALTLPTSNASASEFLQNDGAGALSWASAAAGFSDAYSTVITSATYTVPAGITKLLVFITGGGGGGGGGQNAVKHGSGGGSAATVIARVTVVPLDTITIAVGAAGAGGGTAANGVDGSDSTFTHATGSGSGSMSTITAPGGKKGTYMATTMPVAPAAGTVGANNEGIAILGGFGGSEASGQGAPSFWGPGGRASEYLMMVATVGTAYGSGGGGGGTTLSYLSGAAGKSGICFILEYK